MLPLGASLLGPAVAAAFFSFFVIVFYLFILAILAFAAFSCLLQEVSSRLH